MVIVIAPLSAGEQPVRRFSAKDAVPAARAGTPEAEPAVVAAIFPRHVCQEASSP